MNTSHWPDVLLAICFVVIAVLVFLATFFIGGGYVFSTIKERWHEYSTKKRIKVVVNFLVTFGIIATLLWLSARRA